MKPTKKQNSDLSKRGNSTKEIANSKIKHYFKTAAKSSAVQDIQKNDQRDTTKEFYVAILKKRLEALEDAKGAGGGDMVEGACSVIEADAEECEDLVRNGGECAVDGGKNGIDSRKQSDNPGGEGSKLECPSCAIKTAEYQVLEEKYKEIKKRFMKLTMHHSEVDLKYHDLLKASTGHGKIVEDASTASNGDIFTANELKFLDSMPLDSKKDSTFLHHCLQFAYKGKLGTLADKSLKGKKEWIEITGTDERIHHSAKDPLSPVKVDRMRELFIARISKCTIDAVAYGERIGKINKHLASGIKNISKKQH